MSEWMTRSILCLVLATMGLPRCQAQLTASVNESNFLVLEAAGLELLAVEFRSPSGSLIPSEIASPFDGVLVQDDSLALYYNLGSPFVLNGSVTLAAQWDPTKRNDIQFQYGTPTTERGLEPILGHQTFNAQVSVDPVVVTEDDTNSNGTASDLHDEGQVSLTAWPGEDGLYLYVNADVSVQALSIQSDAGLLSLDGASLLFDSLDFDSSFEVGYSNASPVKLHEEFFLPIRWTGSQLEDLSIFLTTATGETLSAEIGFVRTLPEPTCVAWPTAAVLALMVSCRRLRR